MPNDWLEEERRRGVLRELLRLKRRALRRPFSVLFLALLMTGLVTFKMSRKERIYTARVVFRVAEQDVAIGATPRAKRDLRDYIWRAAFNSERLRALMEKYELYPAAMDLDVQLAEAEFRDNIHLEVFRNYFFEDRPEDAPPRSARLAINFMSKDPEQALIIAQELGTTVIDFETRSRRELTLIALEDARVLVKLEEAEFMRRTRHLNELQARLVRLERSNPTAAMGVKGEIGGEQRSIVATEARMTQARNNLRQLELRARFEQNQSGLRFELIDAATLAGVRRSKQQELIFLAVFCFLFSVPLAGVAVGAFDPRVYEGEDAGRLGLNVLGHVPGFRGDRVGSLRARLDAADRVG